MPDLRKALLLAAVLGIAAVLSGCSSSQGPDPAALEGSWLVESFGEPSGLEEANPAVTSEITLKADRAEGSGGVNSFSSSYEASDDGSIAFSPIAATAMAGPPEASQQESKFFEALEAAESFEFNEAKLVLSDLGNNTLVVLAPK